MAKIRVRYGMGPPWTVVVQNGSSTSLGGIARDVYDSVSKALNIELDLVVQEDNGFGLKGPDGKWSGMLGSIQNNETDLAGPFFVTMERAELVEYSVPIASPQLAIVSGMEASNRSPFVIFRVFSPLVWFVLFSSIIVTTTIATFIYVTLPSPSKKSKREIFFKYAWMFSGFLLNKDSGSPDSWFLNHVWNTYSFRILLNMWLIGPVLVLMYTYQGSITSALSADKLRPIAETIDDIEANERLNPSTLERSYVSNCFEGLKDTRHSFYVRMVQNLKGRSKSVYPEYMEEVEAGDIAFIDEATVLKGYIGKRFQLTGKCELRVTPINYCTSNIAFALRKKLAPHIKNIFNQRTLWYTEGRLAHRHILATTFIYDACAREKAAVVKALALKDFLGAFLIYAIGNSISVIIFLIERLVNSVKCK